ncbi:MAG TPA: glutamine phosphoribosylpyrophosphate amidotransferase [Methylomirabilota bacterium]|jgi:glutamate synthase domain-containing protein 1|nr:glutamine phosphoribosylpyrophosphate amidotransferase [Methylomirabilota bacterium]
MCGIVGFFDKAGRPGRPLGATLLGMLDALACRGPDSSGIALWGEPADGLVVRVKMGEGEDALARRPAILREAARQGRVGATETQGALLRLVVAKAEPVELGAAIEAIAPDVEVVSIGRRLEIVKQVGAPANLEVEFGISRRRGTHGLGHTRLSTESRVDLSHSQPFWAHGTADLAIVHNGHITNYHRLRRVYEQEGVRFYTENDSEIIGIYLARKLGEGLSLREALEASLRDLDGSFSYLAATADAFGFAKDPFCLKPLIVSESADVVAIANEEIALQAALPEGYQAREAGGRAVAVWEVPDPASRLGARPRRARSRRRAA